MAEIIIGELPLFTPCPVLARMRKMISQNQKTQCWEWTGHRQLSSGGYGRLMLGGTSRLAHRVAFNMSRGDFPSHLCICHTCDNPRCVNPEHLFVGTKMDNAKDRDAKKRQATGLRNGRHTKPERTARGDNNGIRKNPDLVRGDNNGRRKLSSVQVEQIRNRHKSDGVSQIALAKEYGVQPNTIYLIIKGKSWK